LEGRELNQARSKPNTTCKNCLYLCAPS